MDKIDKDLVRNDKSLYELNKTQKETFKCGSKEPSCNKSTFPEESKRHSWLNKKFYEDDVNFVDNPEDLGEKYDECDTQQTPF